MPGELIVSVLASTAIGLVSIRVRRYQYWRGWIKRLFWGGLGLFLLLNAILGALAVSLAAALDWQPVEDSWLWNGLILAAAAQGAIRVELPRVPSSTLEAGGSILRRVVAFVIEMLNEASEKAIQRRLDQLSNEELISLAMYVHARYVEGDEQLPKKTRNLMLRQLTEAGEKLDAPEHRDGSRGTLELFCLRQFATRSLRPVARLEPEEAPAPGAVRASGAQA